MKMVEENVVPFAVYGTLREGGRLSSVWQNAATVEKGCRIDGFQLMRKKGFWYPVVVKSPKESVVVDLLWPNNTYGSSLMGVLDSVEGYPSLFGRSLVPVWRANGKLVDAWLYAPNHTGLFSDLEPVGRDWMVFVDENNCLD
jgi:gamma-glutamylcyclotransferase (GGCT)/AIG2-like uncharacterized protein YtfP